MDKSGKIAYHRPKMDFPTVGKNNKEGISKAEWEECWERRMI